MGELDMGDEELTALRKEFKDAGFLPANATDEQLRRLGERLGGWTKVARKRQPAGPGRGGRSRSPTVAAAARKGAKA